MDQVIQNLKPEDSKPFLSTLKKVLSDIKHLQTDHATCDEFLDGLSALVTFYLKCPSKFQGKRVISSFFQNLDERYQNFIQRKLCSELLCLYQTDFARIENVSDIRQSVDNISFLLENFAFGERCLATMPQESLQFLIKAEEYFLSHVDKDVPPVYLNEVMHHCHVTIQTLNQVIQRIIMDEPEWVEEFKGNTKLLTFLMDIDMKIIHNELLLLDCRCCCAMNVFLLIQLSVPFNAYIDMIPHLLFPKAPGNENVEKETTPSWLFDKKDLLFMNNQTPLSFLAIAFGYIAMTAAQKIMEEADHGKFFYTDELLPKLLKHSEKCVDTVSKALYGKTINLWTTRLVASCTSSSVNPNMAKRLEGESPTLQSLLQYVWTHWEDQLDVIRQSAKTVFENVLKMHMASDIAKSEGASVSSFISSLLCKLFNVSWTSRGKFSALSSCVVFVGANCLLSQRDYFPAEVLSQFHDTSLSCYATELYMNSLISHKKELSVPLLDKSSEKTDVKNSFMTKPNEETFLKTWIGPVVKALASSNRKKKNNIIEYLLPRLLKSDRKYLDYMINRLSVPEEVNSGRSSCFGAIIACLRRARVMGFSTSNLAVESGDELYTGVLFSEILKTTLCVLDEQVRLDAFAFLCESNKTTEAVTSFEFEMLRLFIPKNLNSQSPAFRQSFLSYLKKLFTRLKESLSPLKRMAKSKKLDVSEYIQNYKSFLEWVASLLLSNLHPGAAFGRRTTCLTSLSHMNCLFTVELDNFSVSNYMNDSHIQILLLCLADTFEENKLKALTILTTYTQLNGRVTTPEKLLSLFQLSFTLACSTRPQDCGTAAYIMLLLLTQQDIFSLIKGHQIDLKTNTAKEMLSKINAMFTSSYHLVDDEGSKTSAQAYSSIYLLHILVVYLHDQNEVAKQSLITAAANRPMYPTLQCIRYVMQEVKWQSHPPGLISLRRHFIQLLIKICLDISQVVSPVVQNSSPEGNIPAEAILGPGLNLAEILPKSDIDVATVLGMSSPNQASKLYSQMLVEAMPEYLVVCCWRSIKEVSLTLGKVCLQFPMTAIDEESDIEDSNIILSLSNIKIIGAYFTQQLLESIHRGAFELAYSGFQMLCQMLWNHPNSAFHSLPTQWLMQVITDIKSDDPNSKLCATRRSAGVPFFIQAIASSEPFLTGRQCFHSAMKELIVYALDECVNVNDKNESKDVQVHALNIIRALYRDSRLRLDVVPYIADGVRAAIRGFKSNLWSVRNSATLLLSALMTRMFGVKRSKDETAISKKNCQTGRSFFHHYPSLYSFLLSELEEATRSIGPTNAIQLHPSLYPVLLILGRLFPSMLEGSDTSLSLSAFIPYVLKCAMSPVLKTRIIAARALQPLARRNHVVNIAKKLFINIPNSRFDRKSSSHIHGSLLQLCELVKLVADFNSSLQLDICVFFSSELMSRTWLLSSENECFATRQSVLQLVDYVLDTAKLFGALPAAETELEHIQKLKTFFISSLSFTSREKDGWKPLVFEYEKIRAVLCLKYLAELEMINVEMKGSNCSENSMPVPGTVSKFQETAVLNFIQSPFYEVRLQVLGMFISAVTGQSQSQREIKTEMDEQNTMTELSDITDNCGHTLTESIYSCPDNTTGTLLNTVAINLFDYILHMAIEVEEHHECMEKVFCLLSFIPKCDELLLKKNHLDIDKIFTNLLEKIKIERRNEVKEAMLRFTGCFIPFLYNNIKTEETQVHYELFTQWTSLVQDCCMLEEYPDIQISVCYILRDNAATLLCDVDQRLGLLSLHFWNILATLLQEDDLEVKDVATSILALALGLDEGSFHPSFALEKLPEMLLFVHNDKTSCDMAKFLVSWVVQDVTVDIKEPNERLFDRSEMNTYKDYIAFTRCVVKTLFGLFQYGTSAERSSGVCETSIEGSYPAGFTKEIQDPDLVDFLILTFDEMDQELNVLKKQCQTSDAFFNSSRHVSLYHALFQANGLISVFKDVYKNENTIQLKISKLHCTMSHTMEELDICNTLLH